MIVLLPKCIGRGGQNVQANGEKSSNSTSLMVAQYKLCVTCEIIFL